MKLNFSQMSFKEILKSIFGYFGVSVVTCIAILAIVYGMLSLTEKNYCYEVFQSKAELNYYSSKDDLIKCIDGYIKETAPTSVMNGFTILEQCDKYNVDVRFVMAQAQVESHFATTGVASKTHSAFNVLAYDGRSANSMIKAGHGYKHPDESIEPYLKLLTSEYLVNGKTEIDMMDNFVNKNKKRYATSENYEFSLRTVYQKLTEETNISILYSEYQKYKMICGK